MADKESQIIEQQKDIDIAVFVLRSGGTILYPTDTVWGIGCDATDEDAVDAIYELKSRTDKKSMIILVDDIMMIKQYVKEVPKKALEIISSTNEPTTIIFPDAHKLAPNLLAEDGSIGIRVVKNEFCIELIRRLGKPLVSTSANISGEETPLSFEDINVDLICDVDYVVKPQNHNTDPGAKPSRILKLTEDDKLEVIRES